MISLRQSNILETQKNTANNSIFKKIRKNTLIVVIIIITIVIIIIGIGLNVIRQNAVTANNNLGLSAANDAKEALISQIEETLSRLAQSKAAVSDEKFSIIAEHIRIISHTATEIKSNPGKYGRRDISYPDTSNTEGKVTVMVQISDNTNYADVKQEIDLMANIQDLLIAVQINNENVGTTYIGTEAGITVCADPDSAQKTPYFNCRTRMWYINAKAANDLIWTDVFEDYLGRGLAITCAKPFYDANGNIAGVAGMGSFLVTLNDVVVSTAIGETGFAFIMNEKGEMIISDSIKKDANGKIIRDNLLENGTFPRETAQRMISGKSGIERITLDGTEKFIAYHGLKNIPWSFAVVINVDEVIAPAVLIENNIITLKQSTLKSIGNVILIIAVFSGFALLLLILATSLVSFRLAKSLTNPIFKLTEDAALIGSGNLDHTLDIRTGDELEILANAFNKMIANIKEISAEKEFAEQSNRYKSAFLANMSHEIRTPMNAILGIAEIQIQNKNNPEEAEEAFGKIYESGDLLLKIINDILDLSKIEAGKLELFFCNYDIPSLINDTVQINRLRYDSKPIEFNLHIDANTPYNLYGDALRIKQVLNNILSNAFKYTDKGNIDFYVSAEHTAAETETDNVTIIFRVCDTGQGMTQDQIALLFDEYTRFNLEANRTTIGAGLGMSITKRLLNIMNAEIIVESIPGKGSSFTVRIPQKLVDSVVCGHELSEKLRNFDFNSSVIMKKAQFIREFMPYGSVLVVDDVETNIYVIKGMLTPYGLKIDAAYDGFEAVEKVRTGNTYDIIFMDHMMPKMDGVEAVKIIRSMGYTNDIIALTANALLGQEEMFLQNGFNGFISKPIDSRELNHCLNEFIRNKKPQDVIDEARREQLEKNPEQTENPNNLNIEKFFLNDAEKTIKVLEELNKKINSLSNEEKERYITAVHGIKSALTNIGQADLSGTAEKLEKAGRETDTQIMLSETPSLINALQSLIKKLSPKKENNSEKISDDDLSLLKEKLLIIKTSCKELDKKAAKTVLNELRQKKWSSQIETALDDISEFLLHSEFEEAAQRCAGVVSDF
ncbi:MAG: response regulator [Treponema sp.]|nr:response regulator [Treponema sp.]MCL2251111.1 response regulator [Treponema sp.]